MRQSQWKGDVEMSGDTNWQPINGDEIDWQALVGQTVTLIETNEFEAVIRFSNGTELHITVDHRLDELRYQVTKSEVNQ